MSYILDALRKSEQERQIASGRGASMLYPVMAEQNRKNGLKPLVLASSVLVGVAVSTTLIWWVWPKPLASNNAGNTRVVPEKSVVNLVPSVPPAPTERFVSPEPPARPRQQSISQSVVPVPAKPLVELAPKKSSASASLNTGAQAALPSNAVSNQGESESGAGSLKGLPKVTISGFINDEQGANLAIINDKLVREGEEISPGLRLEKIVDENVILSYKGQRFRR